MGSYSDSDHLLPFLARKDAEQAHDITRQMLEAIKKETGKPYKGVMYGGFMITADGVKLLEYNARLGDPEAMNALPIMKTDFVDICFGIINGSLKDVTPAFEDKATVCKYAVPQGYPDNPLKDRIISIPKTDAKIYYGSVCQKNGNIYTTSSRAVACVGIADTLEQAERIAEKAVGSIKGPVFHRKDIGTYELIQKRISHRKKLRREEQ